MAMDKFTAAILIHRQKGGDLTQSFDKSPYTKEMSKGQSDNTNNATKKFDSTTIADRLRTVSWSNYSHPTGVHVQWGHIR